MKQNFNKANETQVEVNDCIQFFFVSKNLVVKKSEGKLCFYYLLITVKKKTGQFIADIWEKCRLNLIVIILDQT